MKNLKYIALGILVSYLGLYVYNLVQTPKEKGSETIFKIMKGTTVFCIALAVLCGFLAQQTIETLLNTYLIKTKKQVIIVPTKGTKTGTKKTNSKKLKSSPVDYYNCLLTQAQAD
nr:2854_t:CDS:2 [Entrophospora candida]